MRKNRKYKFITKKLGDNGGRSHLDLQITFIDSHMSCLCRYDTIHEMDHPPIPSNSVWVKIFFAVSSGEILFPNEKQPCGKIKTIRIIKIRYFII